MRLPCPRLLVGLGRKSPHRRAPRPAARLRVGRLDDRTLPAVVYVNAAWAGVPAGTDPDGAGPATAMGVNAFATIQPAVTAAGLGGTVNLISGNFPENVTLNQANQTVQSSGTQAVTINPASGTAVSISAPGVLLSGNNLLSVTGSGGANQVGIDVALGATNATISGMLVNGFIGTGGVGVRVNLTASARLQSSALSNNLVDVSAAGGSVFLQNTTINNPNDAANNTSQNIGLLALAGAIVDAGGGGTIPGFGTSAGGNTFQGFTGNLGSGSVAILNNNFGGAPPVPTNPTVVYAQNSSFKDAAGAAITKYGDIEQRVFHALDSPTFSYVDYRNAVGATAPAQEGASVFYNVTPTEAVILAGQRSIIRRIDFVLDAPVFGTTGDTPAPGAVTITRRPDAQGSYPWYAGLTLATGDLPAANYTISRSYNLNTGRTTLTVSFAANTGAYVSGSQNFTEFGSLIDGRYRKTINGASLSLLFAGSGAAAATSSEDFLRFFADTSGVPPGSAADGRINPIDAIYFNDASTNPTGSSYRFFLDFNGDGVIDDTDKAARNARNGQNLPAAL